AFPLFQRANASSSPRSTLPRASCSSIKLLDAWRSFALSVAMDSCSLKPHSTAKRAESPPKPIGLRVGSEPGACPPTPGGGGPRPPAALRKMCPLTPIVRDPLVGRSPRPAHSFDGLVGTTSRRFGAVGRRPSFPASVGFRRLQGCQAGSGRPLSTL